MTTRSSLIRESANRAARPRRVGTVAHRAPDDHQRCIAVSDAPERGPALARGRLVTAASRQLTCGRAARRPASVATSPPVPGAKLVLGYEAKAKRRGLYQPGARTSRSGAPRRW